MRVVSNASPLINLAWIGKLDLLSKLYGEVIIPQAVWEEIVVQGKDQPGAEEVRSANWISIQDVEDQALVQSFQRDLDAGESEAIVLALKTSADLLLMDERLGREIAALFNLRVTGVVGILIEAKYHRLISEIKPSLDQLQVTAGFYLKPSLLNRILKDSGEV